MSATERHCKFPGCQAPAAPSGGTGRAPSYCVDPEHNRTTAFAQRRRPVADAVESPAPVTSIGLLPRRMEALIAEFGSAAAAITDTGERILADLANLRDPDAVLAEISAVRADLNAQLAAAVARASQEEHEARTARAAARAADVRWQEATNQIAHLDAEVLAAQETIAEATVAVADAQRRATLAVRSAEEADSLRAAADERAAVAERHATAQQQQAEAAEQRASDATQRRDAALAQAAEATQAASHARQAAADAAARTIEADKRTSEERENAHRLSVELASAHADHAAQLAAITAERDEARRQLASETAHLTARLDDQRQRVVELRAQVVSEAERAARMEQEVSRLRAELAAALAALPQRHSNDSGAAITAQRSG